MSSAAQHGSDNRPSRGNHLQPDDDLDAEDHRLLGDLVAVEDERAARELQRQVEADIITTLQLQGFDIKTPEWKAFAVALIEYGFAVFKGWLISGVVYRMAATHGKRGVYGVGRIPENLQLVPSDAHDLAMDLVFDAVDAFRRKTLMHPDPSRRWRVSGGASIKTYFIGRCLMQLPDTYKRWATQQSRFAGQGARYAKRDVNDHRDASADPATAAVAVVTADEVLSETDPVVSDMFRMFAEGFSYAEIAEMLTVAGIPTTVSQVGTRLSRARTRAKKKAS